MYCTEAKIIRKQQIVKLKEHIHELDLKLMFHVPFNSIGDMLAAENKLENNAGLNTWINLLNKIQFGHCLEATNADVLLKLLDSQLICNTVIWKQANQTSQTSGPICVLYI